MKTRLRIATAITAAVAIATLPALPAHSDPVGSSHSELVPVVTGLVGPTHIAFGSAGRLYIADAFASQIVKASLKRDTKEVIYQGEGSSPSGLDVKGSKVYFVASSEPADEGDQGGAGLFVTRHGETRELADTLQHELTYNPDNQPQTTGEQADALSNPYSVLVVGGRVFVADAGANDILELKRDGSLRTVVALPVSKEGECAAAENNGVANGGCDPVPTDIEVGPDGYLYVSGLGAEVEGHIWKADPDSGAIVDSWDGFPPLTGIAVDRDGTIYASSLFANSVFRIDAAGNQTVAEVPGPTDVELYHGKLYAASASLGDGPPAGQVFYVPKGLFQ